MHGNPGEVCDIGRDGGQLKYEHSVDGVAAAAAAGTWAAAALGGAIPSDRRHRCCGWARAACGRGTSALSPSLLNNCVWTPSRIDRVAPHPDHLAEGGRSAAALPRHALKAAELWRRPHRRHERRGGQGRWRQARGSRDHAHRICAIFREPLPPAGGWGASHRPDRRSQPACKLPSPATLPPPPPGAHGPHAPAPPLPCPAVQEEVGQDEAGRQAVHVLQ